MSEEYRNNEEQNEQQNEAQTTEVQSNETQNNETAQDVNFVMQGSVQRENESDIASSENAQEITQEAQTTEASSAAQETAAAYESQFTAAEEKHSFEKKAKNKKKGGWKKGVAVAAAVVIGVGAVGTGGYYGAQSLKTSMRNWISQEVASQQSSQTAKTATLSQSDSSSTTNTTGSTGATLLDVSDVVKNIKPSVVAVTNELLYTANYFGRTASQTSPASGSGVIIGENDEELLIVTNYHVVSGEDSISQMYTVTSENISVQFIDGTSADTTLKGTDEAADLAVLAVKKSDLSDDTMNQIKIATIGDSSTLSEGEGVIAIGNALGYGLSATVGYVSALDRELTVNNNTNTYIQTDAAINPGNSGGGLFNTAGELIGINDAKTVDTNVEGMGYAIPISNVGDIITELMNEEPRTQVSDDKKGYLGISGQDIDASMSKVYGMPEGVLVAYVQEDSAAEQAGLQKHDIICAIDGTEVSSFEKLREEIGYYAAGEQAELTVERLENGQYTEKKITVTFGSYAEEAPEGGTIPADEANGN